MKDFSSIISKLLEVYNDGGMNHVIEYIESLELQDETKNEISESFKILDKLSEKRISLELSKDEGDTTKEWLENELYKLKEKVKNN